MPIDNPETNIPPQLGTEFRIPHATFSQASTLPPEAIAEIQAENKADSNAVDQTTGFVFQTDPDGKLKQPVLEIDTNVKWGNRDLRHVAYTVNRGKNPALGRDVYVALCFEVEDGTWSLKKYNHEIVISELQSWMTDKYPW